MRALRANHACDPAELAVVDVPPPSLSGDEVLVRVRAAGVNRSDALACRGILPGPFPRTLGRDFAGDVVEGPDQWRGKRVWGTGGGELGLARDGTHCEYLAIPAVGACEIPEGLSYSDAAASALAYFTASAAWAVAGGVEPGMTVVVTGAMGGVGNAAASLAKHRHGARVIGVVRSSSAEAARDDPAIDVVVRADKDDPPAVILQVTDGRGAHRCVDMVGGSLGVAVLGGLAIRAGACILSSPPDSTVSLDLLDFYRRELRLAGLHTGRFTLAEAARSLDVIGDGFRDGTLRPSRVHGRYGLEDAPVAYGLAEQGAGGRLVFLPPGLDAADAAGPRGT